MAIEIKAIQCPKCGSTQKTEIRSGDFRCESCGTEYFLDDDRILDRQEAPKPVVKAPESSLSIIGWFVATIVGIIIWIANILPASLFSSKSSPKYAAAANASTTSGPAEEPFYWSGSDYDLYLSADKKPVLLTLGTKKYHDHPEKNASYASFTDVGDGSEIKRLAVSFPSSLSSGNNPIEFALREFSNGDIYIIANNTLLLRVQKTAYAIKELTKTLFEDQKDLVSGIAKIDFVYPNLGEGFNLITNDGRTYFYYPATNKLYTEQTVYTERLDAKKPAADSTEKIGFSFSIPDAGIPDASQQLIKFQYRDAKDAKSREFGNYPGYKWDDPRILKEQGILSFKDFTPGRTYFGYRLLYSDKDYVLISYQITPAKNAGRNMQCLDAHTAAILFTTKLDADQNPTACVRYKDGFALADIPNMYALDLKGKIVKRTPVMYKNN